MTPLPPKRWTHSGVLICGKLEAKKWVSSNWGLQKGSVALNSDQVLGRVEVQNWRPRREVKSSSEGNFKKELWRWRINHEHPEGGRKAQRLVDTRKRRREKGYTQKHSERGRWTRKQNERRKGDDHNSIFFWSLSIPRITPRTRRFPTTYLLVALSAKPPNLKNGQQERNTQREGKRLATTFSPAPKPAKWEYPTWRRYKLTHLDDQTLNWTHLMIPPRFSNPHSNQTKPNQPNYDHVQYMRLRSFRKATPNHYYNLLSLNNRFPHSPQPRTPKLHDTEN